MISSNDFRNGVTVEMDGDAWQVIDFQHVKPGKGAAFVRAKMKNKKIFLKKKIKKKHMKKKLREL